MEHQAIYRSLFVQARGVFRKQLLRELRAPHFAATVAISERPAEAADHAVPGHWEADLFEGAESSFIVTLVERRSRYVILGKIASRDTPTVMKTLALHIQKLPGELCKAETMVRGVETHVRADFSVQSDLPLFLCDPRTPWQRGSNENTTALLRQYFPHGKSVAYHTQPHLDSVARELNDRPRQTLGFRSPAEVLSESVSSS